MNFRDYSNYYNLLYKDKDYKAETAYVHTLVTQYHPKAMAIMDLGCGTGKHVFEFEKLGYEVAGVDLSEQMIRIAEEIKESNQSKAGFEIGDIRHYRNNSNYDAVVSLFHVMSYQVTDNDLLKTFETARLLLLPGGVFVFDYWHGPAVLKDRPTSRVKIFENETIKVKRISKAEMIYDKHLVNVSFDITIEHKRNNETISIQENHLMRYLFVSEIENFAKQAGYEVMQHYNWMQQVELDEKSWYGLSVLRAI